VVLAEHDRSAETLIGLIKQWILPGTNIIIDCLAAYSSVREEGYTHFTVNHSMTFVDATTGTHINTILSTWKHVKVLLNTYNRKDYIYILEEYLFRQRCKAEDVDLSANSLKLLQVGTTHGAIGKIHSPAMAHP
jgi:hypothetical protein